VVDVYRQVWEMAGRFDGRRGTVTAWLIMLARSRAVDRRRHRDVRTRNEAPAVQTDEAASSELSPESLAITRQTGHAVSRALEAVPREQRVALELAFFSGLSHSEIAGQLGEPLGTVKTRIRLGVVKLRELLRGTV
jgi:RNA polymerase sigma-70 factor, ECF subfamily